MVPIDEYPMVSERATLLEAIRVFNAAQRNQAPGRQPYRAVLVKDDGGRVVGKVGQMAFLRAIEPRRSMLKDVEGLGRAGVDSGYVDSILANYRLFEEPFSDMCLRSLNLRVKDAMHPVNETISEDAGICEAIRLIVQWQQLSLLVMRGESAVGLLRLSDLCDEVARQMMRASQAPNDTGTE
jgi:CBS domain-containing protein